MRKVGEAANETIQKGVQQIRDYFNEREVRLPNLKDLIRHLPPRQALILTYLDWVHWNEKNGLQRQKSQTPYEYANAIHQRWPELETYLTPFTDDFVAARYTPPSHRQGKTGGSARPPHQNEVRHPRAAIPARLNRVQGVADGILRVPDHLHPPKNPIPADLRMVIIHVEPHLPKFNPRSPGFQCFR